MRESSAVAGKMAKLFGFIFSIQSVCFILNSFRKPQEKYLNYFQERLRQLNFVPVEEVGLCVCMVRGRSVNSFSTFVF